MAFFFSIAAGLIFVSALFFIFFFMRARAARRGLVTRSLNLALLLVRFPPVLPEQNQGNQQIREKIAMMETLYANLSSMKDGFWSEFFYGKPSFALELTIPSIGEELHFYVAVPRRHTHAVEKIIQGVFPTAHVEETKDYNVFHPDGASLASRVMFQENPYSPVRTYMKLESDPLGPITNVFTKLAAQGEGASFQIIARPAAKKWIEAIKKKAKERYTGKKHGDDALVKVLKTVVDISEGGSMNEQEKKYQEESKKLTPLEEEIVKGLESKIGKPVFEVNIRLIASAKTGERASSILRALESAFSQFSDPTSNRFQASEVKGRAREKTFFDFSFRNFDPRAMMLLNTEELTSIFHFPNVPLDTPKIRQLKSREAPPPVNLPQEGLLLGYNQFRGDKKDIYLLDDDRRRHLYTIGQTGTGKSVFLENMIVQDIEAGKGVCVIDPHGELINTVMGFIPRHRMQDVIYFDPGDTARPLGLNMLEYDLAFPEHKTLIVNELFAIFEKLFDMKVAGGPIFEQYFRNATTLVLEDPPSGNTIIEIQRVLSDKAFRDMKIARSKNIIVNQFWTQVAEKAGGEASLKDLVPYIASKIDNFISNEIMRPIVAQEKSAFNFREVMDSGKILLVNLSKGRLGELNSSFLGLILVGKLLIAALSRVNMDMDKRKDFYLYIDEFQNVTTDSIATILSEARKYRLDLIITHQFIGQLKEEIQKAVFGNIGSIVTFRIGTNDAEFMAKQYKPVFEEMDLLKIDNYNACVKLLIRGETSTPFSMKTYPPRKGDPEIVELAKEISRTKYGRPREEIEEEIAARFSAL